MSDTDDTAKAQAENPVQASARRLGAAVIEEVARLLAFDHAAVFEASNGEGFYTLIYRNGERGPRSEGYADGAPGARDAVLRDFGGIVPVRMLPAGQVAE